MQASKQTSKGGRSSYSGRIAPHPSSLYAFGGTCHESYDCTLHPHAHSLHPDPIAIWVEAIAIRFEASAIRLEAIAMEAIAISLCCSFFFVVLQLFMHRTVSAPKETKSSRLMGPVAGIMKHSLFRGRDPQTWTKNHHPHRWRCSELFVQFVPFPPGG